MSTLILAADSLLNREFSRTLLVGTSECFCVGQVVRFAADPLRLETGKDNKGATVLRKVSKQEYIAAYPEATRPHNAHLMQTANFYEVGVD